MAIALHHAAVADRLRAQYHQLHHDDLAGLVRRDQEDGRISNEAEPVPTAIRLAGLAEGLAYYVLIDVLDAATARAQLLGEVARLYGER